MPGFGSMKHVRIGGLLAKRCPVVGGMLLVAAAVGLLWWSPWEPREPVYQGKPLRYWLRGYRAGGWSSWNSSTPEAADEAIKHIGTNAIPILLRMLPRSDSALDKKLFKWSYTWRHWAGKQPFFKIPPMAHLPSYESDEATHAFMALGPEAGSAVPSLIYLLDQNLPPSTQCNIEVVLAWTGPTARQAVPALLKRLQDASPYVRGNALYALGCIHAESESAVPRIAKALGDPDANVRGQAAAALQAYGAEAKSAVPALLETLKKHPRYPANIVDGPRDPTDDAKEALKAIDPEAAAKAGLKKPPLPP
jgi:hypothetical protein